MSCLFTFFCFFGFSQQPEYTLSNLSINSEYPHFGLSKVGHSKILFTSYQLNKKEKPVLVGGNTVLEICEANVLADGSLSDIKPLKIDKDVELPTITSATIDPSGSYLYVTTLYTKRNKPKGDFKETNFHIEVAEYLKGVGWTNFKVLPFCNPRYSYAHPAFSGDGKTLYFTANIRGGKETTKGGSDIFKVDVLDNNTFGEPENLGSKVNSYSKDMFPFVTNNAIYFVSDRPNGYGGFDIYKSAIDTDGTYTKAEKLIKPLNSAKDDLSIVLISDSSGYIVSKRDGGQGDDDVYYFKKN